MSGGGLGDGGSSASVAAATETTALLLGGGGMPPVEVQGMVGLQEGGAVSEVVAVGGDATDMTQVLSELHSHTASALGSVLQPTAFTTEGGFTLPLYVSAHT